MTDHAPALSHDEFASLREVGKGEPLTRMRPEVAPFFVGNWAAIEDATVLANALLSANRNWQPKPA